MSARKKDKQKSNACHNSYQKAIIGFVSEQVSYTRTLTKETKPFSNFTKNICVVELLITLLMKTLRQNIDQLLHSANQHDSSCHSILN